MNAKRNPFHIGASLYLRPLEREDAATVAAWLNDPDVARTIHRAHPLSRKAEESYIDRLAEAEDALSLGIVVTQGDLFIGTTGFHTIDWRSRHASFGIAIGEKAQWGRGYGKEATALMVRHAFETLNLNRVWLHVLASHARAIRAYERVGFIREGVLRQALYREGRQQDLLTMAILREEWKGIIEGG